MVLKCSNLFFTILIALVALAGCDRAQKMIVDEVPSDTNMDNTMMGMEAIPVKLVWLINFDDGGHQETYNNWVASIAETLIAPEELRRSRIYNNVDPEMRPHRYVEFEFESYLDAATYMNRPEIAALLQESTNHVTDQTVHTFIQDVDYTYAKEEEGDWQIKHVYLIDYFLGGRQAYLEWARDVSTGLISPTQLKAVASYDNYYGESPHRLVELEFPTQEDADAYHALEEVIQMAEAELERQAGNWSLVMHKFELSSDYINE
ncbi:hypothetical protein F4X90_00560 [Candidatus Poribacteria bacterium]|nr:hypothetical protein [Candidatus Poribacteria bacterium]